MIKNHISIAENPFEKKQPKTSKLSLDGVSFNHIKNTRLALQMQELYNLAMADHTTTIGSTVRNRLAQFNDPDVAKYRQDMERMLIGNDLTLAEIFEIIDQIDNDSAINYKELYSTSSDLSKIFSYYYTSEQTRNYFNGMLMFQPGQRIGPGELLLATHSKQLTKGIKGDIITISGVEIELKGGLTPGRFRDQDLMQNTSAYHLSVVSFMSKYRNIMPLEIKTGYSMARLVEGIKNNPDRAEEIAEDAANVISALWGHNEYISAIKESLVAGNDQLALYYHGLANLKAYFDAKHNRVALLFIDASVTPATTHYADNFADLLKHSNIKVTSAYPISPGLVEAFPKISAVFKSK